MAPTSSKEFIITVAAGSGSRFGAALPKQFCDLAGGPLLFHTLRNIAALIPQAHSLLVISREMEPLWLELCSKHGFVSPPYVFGGSTRFYSVKAALEELKPQARDSHLVYVHDAARPLLRGQVIERLRMAMAAEGCIGAVPAVALADSVRQLCSDGSSVAVDRSMFRAVQTPQLFRFGDLWQAYGQDYDSFFTDDASVVERFFNRPVALVEGSPDTIKITGARDMAFVSTLL